MRENFLVVTRGSGGRGLRSFWYRITFQVMR